ncbi:MAG: transglycosylase domain-containing protein [Holosporales bacterium]|nr:transglycosylase domain-containing protein [Holosporales bacterium]
MGSIIFVVLLSILLVFFIYGKDLPSELTLLDYSPPSSTRIFSSDNELMEEYAFERRVIIKFDKIPNLVKGAFLIAEDKDFYKHAGISVKSLLRAIIENTSKKLWRTKPAGGSTITQQVAKNLLVGNDRSISRKIREAIMAFRIESSINKDKILEIYLNHIYLGKGCYGIAEACDYYFGKKVEEIGPEEAAFLASLPSAPSAYLNMKDNSKLLLKRNSILSQMYDLGFINKDQLLNSLAKPISVKNMKSKLLVPYFSEEVRKLFSKYVSTEQFLRGGYNIITTMDKKLQKTAQKCLEDGLIALEKIKRSDSVIRAVNLQEIEKKLPKTVNNIFPVVVEKIHNGFFEAKNADEKKFTINSEEKLKVGDFVLCREMDDHTYELFKEPKASGGIVVMDADNGDILAMSGGYSFDINSFNCATQAKRQPGSAIKPFVYAAALESGMDEYDEIDDKPVTIKLENGKYYSPKNYSKKVYGKMPMRDGLIYSRNLATINLVQKIGYKKVFNLLKNVNLVGENFNLSCTLGAHEVTLLNLVSAFSVFLNEGNMVHPRFIKYITQQKYRETYIENSLCKNKITKGIISEETAESIKNMLRDTAKYGTAQKLADVFEKFDVDVGGKTGTTNDFKDAWFIGYITKGSKTIIVGIFVGYMAPISLGEHASGSRIALPIFLKFLQEFCWN